MEWSCSMTERSMPAFCKQGGAPPRRPDICGPPEGEGVGVWASSGHAANKSAAIRRRSDGQIVWLFIGKARWMITPAGRQSSAPKGQGWIVRKVKSVRADGVPILEVVRL